MLRGRPWARSFGAALLVGAGGLVNAACSSDDADDNGEGEAMPDCEPPSPDADGGVQLEAEDGEVNVLGLSPLPLPRDEEIKLVWRVTGSGDLELSSTAPDGRSEPPIDGPTPHGSSTFVRPGDEWGSFFRFDTAGCWQLAVRRGEVRASVDVPVS